MKHVKEMRKFAIREGLSRQELDLWLYLYTEMAELGQWDEVVLETPVLMQELQMCRSAFYRTRARLMGYSLLKVQRRAHRVFYSLNLNWDTVAVAEAMADDEIPDSTEEPNGNREQHANEAKERDTAICREPGGNTSLTAAGPETATEGEYPEELFSAAENPDVMVDERFLEPIREFCRGRSTALRVSLLHWCGMRSLHGWPLQEQGLKVLLEKLKTTAEEAVRQRWISQGKPVTRPALEEVDAMMEQIVDQSIRRQWRGFYPLAAGWEPKSKNDSSHGPADYYPAGEVG